MPIISIIIPIYNAEKDLSRCIDSILSQTFQDWECILVNDGSSDHSDIVCNEYVRNDARFRYFEKENGGPSPTRNYGIEQACGDFLCFIDSDDYVGQQFLEHLIRPMLSNDKVMITVSGMQKVGKESGKFPIKPISDTLTNLLLFEHLLKGDIVKGWLCNKCFRKSLIGDARLNESLRYCEDLEFQLRLTFKEDKYLVKFVNYYDYYYNIQDGHISLSHNVRNKVSMIEKFFKCLDVYPDTFAKRVRLLKGCLTQCRSLATLDKLIAEDKSVITRAKRVFLKYYPEALRFFNKYQLAQITLIFINFRLYKLFINHK